MKTFKKSQITEQFLTIQGEGPSIGRPAYFIRLAGCNLWCKWCDSLHSVDPHQFHGKTKDIQFEEVPAEVPVIVITGGEPTLFDLRSIHDQIRIKNPNARIEVESNSTVFNEDIVELFYWNLSPKLKSSDQKNSMMDSMRLDSIKDWAKYCLQKKNVIFKFVLAHENDFLEILELVSLHGIPKDKIYLMAEGQTQASQSLKNVENIIEFAKKHNMNYSPRLHISLWEKKRGV